MYNFLKQSLFQRTRKYEHKRAIECGLKDGDERK